ncbi:MAG: glycyl-radical enzyme activating protein [Clostridia bacterium]|nr:glycyl-radical enzyme activating protein [Clostridia bacterium]
MIQLNISDIQHFSVGDGPGIRTTVFLKGCNLRCPWCHNPETVSRDTVTLTYPKANKSVTYGRSMTVDEIVTEVMEDADFYRQSGGGVTLSGGEPLLQAEAVAKLSQALQGHGISVLLDTAGCVPWCRFEAVLPSVDTVFFDWKTSDPTIMRERIGGDLPLIKSNLARLLRTDKGIHVRIPLIPGVNTSEEALTAIAADLRETGAKTVALLPFHRLAVGKYEAMGIPYPYRDTPPLPADTLRRAAEILSPSFTVYAEK